MQLSMWLSQERGRSIALAKHLAVPGSFVSKMSGGEKPIPLDHCPYIEQFTGGAVTCEEMRPDKVEYFRLLRETSGPNQTKPPVVPAVRSSVAINSVAAQGV